MTVIGIVALALLFVGLALSIVALILLFRRSGRTPIVAIVVVFAGYWMLRRGTTNTAGR